MATSTDGNDCMSLRAGNWNCCGPAHKMVCCRCNRRGLCKGCSCVKDGRHCIDCLPCREGNCHNLTPAAIAEPGLTTSRTLDDQAPQQLGSTSPLISSLPPTISPSYVLSDAAVHSADPEPDKTSDADEDYVADEDHMADFRPPSCPRDICDLPHFEELADPNFVWGSLDGPTCVSVISDSYDVVVHWRPNLFRLPAGRVGEHFIKELSRLFSAFASKSSLESVALKAAFLLPHLILQCSSPKLHPKDITAHIDRRLSQCMKVLSPSFFAKVKPFNHISLREILLRRTTNLPETLLI